jgi:hypothetical protein
MRQAHAERVGEGLDEDPDLIRRGGEEAALGRAVGS